MVKPEYPDWSYLRSTVATFACAAALSASLLVGSAYFEGRMEQEYRRDSDRLSTLGRRYLAVDEEGDVIRDFFPQFMELHKTGLLGKEHRLNWVEVLQTAGSRFQLPSLSYEISAQKAHNPDILVPAGRYKIFVSEMTLNMQLLHEGDLFALLDLLNEQAKGLYTVAGCELIRNFVQLAATPKAGNVTATCVLEWFSIRPTNDAEIKA